MYFNKQIEKIRKQFWGSCLQVNPSSKVLKLTSFWAFLGVVIQGQQYVWYVQDDLAWKDVRTCTYYILASNQPLILMFYAWNCLFRCMHIYKLYVHIPEETEQT